MSGGIGISRPRERHRSEIAYEAVGIKGYNWQPENVNSTYSVASGTTVGGLVGFRAGDVITSVIVQPQANAATSTLVKVGVYDTSGNRLAVSADSDALDASAPKMVSIALTATYTVTADTALYLVLLQVASTPAVLYRAGNLATLDDLTLPLYVKEAGQTDLDATATFVAESNAVWFGWA